MKFGFGKRVKPRQFDYLPRFYDEAKEKLESQVSKYDGKIDDEEKVKERIKAGMRQKFYGDAEFRRRETNKSNIRLVYIIIVLCFVTYMVLKSDKITRILESF